jgi:hypothetical protein
MAAQAVRRVLAAPSLAPEWTVERWFNTDAAPTVGALRGKVIALHAFQMLCPGCVAHGIPQAQRMQALLADRDLVVVGLHCVFEHHEAMVPRALEAFLHEYRVTFPVGVDARELGARVPTTMRDYRLEGTPSLVLIDRRGRIRYHRFGRPADLEVGARVAELLTEPTPREATLSALRDVARVRDRDNDVDADADVDAGCDADGCLLPRV